MKLIFLAVAIVTASSAFADFDVGVGLTSMLSGQYVPALSGGYVNDDWMVTAASTGLQTSIYYQSSYMLAAYKAWKAGDFWWGPVYAGFGAGVGLSQRGYKAGPTAPVHNDSDFNFGPAFRVTWMFLPSAYLNFDMVYGLGLASLELAGQDNAIFSIGLRL